MEPLVVEVRRGEVVEAVHRVHAVAIADGRVVLEAGDAQQVSFLRSAAKPLQVLPVLEACPWLDDEQLVLCCSSHLATPEQLSVVRRILATAGCTEDDLECGADPTRIQHTCSGKHAGFLALCRARGWETAGYRLEGHPLQRLLLDEVALLLDVLPSDVPVAIDGCGVPTYGATLEAAARAFARLRDHAGGERVIAALGRRPELLRGPVAADAVVMGALPGWVAKGGAEGLFCAASPDGLAVALKVEDGAFRAIRPALATLFRRLGIDAEPVSDPVLNNSRGEVVGSIETRP